MTGEEREKRIRAAAQALADVDNPSMGPWPVSSVELRDAEAALDAADRAVPVVSAAHLLARDVVTVEVGWDKCERELTDVRRRAEAAEAAARTFARLARSVANTSNDGWLSRDAEWALRRHPGWEEA